MSSSSYQSSDSTSKTNLKVVKLQQPDAVRGWGVRAPDNMPVGRYKVKCESAAKTTKYGKPMAEFQFTVVDGDFAGVSLPGWIPLHMRAGKIKPGCRYEKNCEMALGRELISDEDRQLRVFVGKVFVVDARYRRTDGKSRTLEDDTVQKGSTDELRVGLILGLSEE